MSTEYFDDERLAAHNLSLRRRSRAEQLALAEAMLYEPCDEAEIEGNGWVEAGAVMAPYVGGLKAASPEVFERQRRYMQLMTLLLPELKQWMGSWNLGASFEVVYAEAQRCVYGHLKQPTSELGDWLEALLAEDAEDLPTAERRVRSQTASVISKTFTSEDWQYLATVAAEGMSQGVLQVAQRESMPPVAV